MPVLTAEQRQEYEEQGYLLASGLISEEIALAGEAAMWQAIQADPADPTTWASVSSRHSAFDGPALVACYTPDVLGAAAELGREDPQIYRAPSRGYAINVFPQPGEWTWPHPHIDHAIKEHGHKTFPRAFRLASMLFLHDVAPYGGGTVVWPGSHRKLEALAKSDPVHYELMWTLNQELSRADLGAPLELTPKRGDILFYHYLCAHAGSKNISDRPRLAMNMKW